MNGRKLAFYFGVSLAAISVIGIAVCLWYSFYERNHMDDVRESAGITVSNETVPYPSGTVETVVINPETMGEEIVCVDSGLICPVNFYSLWDECSDIYGWLRIPGTVIDYPVLQNIDDPDYYLRKDFDGNYYSAGNLYSQYNYNHDFDGDSLTVIYGHHMRNNTMFGILDMYDDPEYVSSHQYIYFYTMYHSYRYRVVGVVTADNTNLMYTYSQAENSFSDDFNNGSIGLGWYEDSFSASSSDRFIVLSTCRINKMNRQLVIAVREEVL